MNFDKDFIMELFLDDTVSTLNKVVVAVANVVNENNENTSCFDELVIKEQSTQMMQDHIQNVKKKSEVTDVKAYFENFVVKFTEQDYIEKYQMKKTTVQALINSLMEIQSGCTNVPLEKKVHIFLWILTSDYSFSETGDSNYRLRKNLITPFTSEELLTTEEIKFNEVHWKARSYIGHAFELLKDRFKKLNHLDVNKQESNNTIILAACVLHNFVILHEGCSQIKHEPVICDDHIIVDREIVTTAVEKRQYLCNYINYLDSN
ncbi:PREDICTED: uncharacterized protein LOC106100599 isoform X2 [Papilio polytes]|uniref:uncharacterized protein LOC106100599 isoform X2 n=1 Tax=Papilio polytes TaxID=76194 RepID=UPI0006760243|nr:PREDICTED: uncharacterized protein LOC106100599 isoform X2 [Papilio polytes]